MIPTHRAAVLAAAVALAAMPATAHAHVTLQPDEVPAGGFERVDVRVPNERDDARTTKVEVQFPPGFIFISYEPVAGLVGTREDGPARRAGRGLRRAATRSRSTPSRSPRDGEGIRPGQFQDFGLSLGMPDKAGTALTFKALQTYSNGEVVRWIGAPDADEPAPQVRLAAAEPEAAAHGAGQDATTQQPAAAAATPPDDGGGDALSSSRSSSACSGCSRAWPAWRPPAARGGARRRRGAGRRVRQRAAARGRRASARRLAAGLVAACAGAGGARRRARARRADPHDAAPGRDRRAVPPYRRARLQRAGRGHLRRGPRVRHRPARGSTPARSGIRAGKQAQRRRRPARGPRDAASTRPPTASSPPTATRSRAASPSASASPWPPRATPRRWRSCSAAPTPGPRWRWRTASPAACTTRALLLLVGALFFRLPRLAGRHAPAAGPRGLLVGACLLGAAERARRHAFSRARSAAGVPLDRAPSASVLEAAALHAQRGRRGACARGRGPWRLPSSPCCPGAPAAGRRRPSALPVAALVASLPYAGHADTHSPRALLIPADVLHVARRRRVARRPGAAARRLLAPARRAPGRGGGRGHGALLAPGAARDRSCWPPAGSCRPGSTWVGRRALSTHLRRGRCSPRSPCSAASSRSPPRNRRRLARLSRDAPGDGWALRRSMRAEVLLAVLVLARHGHARAGRAARRAGERAGRPRAGRGAACASSWRSSRRESDPNDFHLYLFDRRTGAQIDRVEEITVRLTQPERGHRPDQAGDPAQGPRALRAAGRAARRPGHVAGAGRRAGLGLRPVHGADRARRAVIPAALRVRHGG